MFGGAAGITSRAKNIEMGRYHIETNDNKNEKPFLERVDQNKINSMLSQKDIAIKWED